MTLALAPAFELARRTKFPVRLVAILVLLRFVSMLFEGIGIAMILPIIEYIGHDGGSEELRDSSVLWEYVFYVFDRIGLPVSLLSLMSVVVAAILFRQTFQYTFEVLNIRSVHGFIHRVQAMAFESAIRSKIEETERKSQGYFVNIIVTEAVRGATLLWAVMPFATAVVLFTAYFVSLFLISVSLSVALIAAFVLNALIMLGLMRRTAAVGKAVTSSNDALSTFIVSRIPFIRQAKLGGTEQIEIQKCAETVGRLQANMAETKVLKARIPLVVQPFAIITILGFLFLGIEVLSVPIAELILFCGITARVVPILQTLITTAQETSGVWASLSAVVAFFRKTDAQSETNSGAKPFPQLAQGITLSKVSYAYPQSHTTAIHDVSAQLPANRWTALVGPSGSGKSTLIDLLPRLREPELGEIKYDGVSASEIKLFDLRGRFAFVSQSPQLLPGSFRDHISYGRRTIDDSKLREVTDTVGMLEFIEGLPEGFDSQLGENANRLSGGQKQRLDIARALACDAQIVILDEPTTGLDPESRYKLKQTLRAIVARGDTTLVTISHDLDLVEFADQIVVLINGAISGVGNHEDLLRENSWYRNAHRKDNANPGKAPDADEPQKHSSVL